MKSWSKIFLAVIFIAVLVWIFVNLSQTKIPSPILAPISSTTATPSATINNPNGACHLNGVLPDPNCTPGSIDPKVTQNNLDQTICVRGYTKTVRPPVSYTNNLKVEQIAQYGYADTLTSNYEEDHLISLELGGSPTDPKNLWPEPGKTPNPKDRIENLCHQKICNRQITLAQAQKEIATNWPTACQQ